MMSSVSVQNCEIENQKKCNLNFDSAALNVPDLLQ